MSKEQNSQYGRNVLEHVYPKITLEISIVPRIDYKVQVTFGYWIYPMPIEVSYRTLHSTNYQLRHF